MKDVTCCDMRGMLSFLLLFLIAKKPMHGQEIADELEKRRGERPSPGTIYPALKALKEAGFVKEKKKRKTIFCKFSKRRSKRYCKRFQSQHCCSIARIGFKHFSCIRKIE